MAGVWKLPTSLTAARRFGTPSAQSAPRSCIPLKSGLRFSSELRRESSNDWLWRPDTWHGAGEALCGLLWVTRPCGIVPAPVMSLLGWFRHSLVGIVAAEDEIGAAPRTMRRSLGATYAISAGVVGISSRYAGPGKPSASSSVPVGSWWRLKRRTGRRWATGMRWRGSQLAPSGGRDSSITRNGPARSLARSTVAPHILFAAHHGDLTAQGRN